MVSVTNNAWGGDKYDCIILQQDGSGCFPVWKTVWYYKAYNSPRSAYTIAAPMSQPLLNLRAVCCIWQY